MANTLFYLAAAAALSATVNGRNLQILPEATRSVVWPSDGMSPRPTLPPLPPVELLKRQTSSPVTALVAPDNTCGYVSGLIGAAYTCNDLATCAFITASAGDPGAVACCNTVTCGIRVACLDLQAVSVSSLCDSGCEVDDLTLKCTNTALPFCNTISFPGDIMDYWCNTVDISTAQAAQTTFQGETDGRSFSPLVLSGDDSSTTFEFPTGGSGTGSPSSPTSSSSSSSGSGGGGGHSTPVGAIVGGVVGGLAVIGLIVLGIILLLRSKNKNSQQPLGQPPVSSMQQQLMPPYNPNNMTPHQSVYDPKYAANMTQQPVPPPGQPYPSPPLQGQGFGTPPQGQFQNSTPPAGYYPPGTTPERNQSTSPSIPSPTHSYQQMPPYNQQAPPMQTQQTIYESGGEVVGAQGAGVNPNHHGQMHELA